MNILIPTFCLLIPLNVFAQKTDSLRNDTTRRFIIVDSRSIDGSSKPLYVIDGIIFKGDIKEIKPEAILQVAVLGQPGASSIYGKDGANGVVLIETLNYGVEYYQRKLCNFSMAYRQYLYMHKAEDSNLLYVVNGVVLAGSQSTIIKMIFSQIEKVKTVHFIEKLDKVLNTNNSKAIVVITTKE